MKRMQLSHFPALICLAVLILDSRDAVGFAAQGIELCIRTVIPSLFPFFVLSSYLTGNLSSGTGFTPVILAGFLGGYPVGAQAVSESWRKGRIPEEAANRLLMFCSQAGPSFLFGMIGQQFPQGIYVWKLWAIQLLSGFSVAFLQEFPQKRRSLDQGSGGITLPDAMKQALRSVASVCGWVIIFRIILGFLSFLHLSGTAEILTAGFLELSNGCLLLDQINNVELRFLLAAVMLNFGGICVMVQTASVIHGLKLSCYLMGKCLQTGFSVLYSLCFLGHYGALIPIACIFLLFRRQIPGKNSSIPVRLGV